MARFLGQCAQVIPELIPGWESPGITTGKSAMGHCNTESAAASTWIPLPDQSFEGAATRICTTPAHGISVVVFISSLCFQFPKILITASCVSDPNPVFHGPKSARVEQDPKPSAGFADGTSHCPHGTRRQPPSCVCVFYLASFALSSHPIHLLDFVRASCCPCCVSGLLYRRDDVSHI